MLFIRILSQIWLTICFINSIGVSSLVAQEDAKSKLDSVDRSLDREIDFERDVRPILQNRCFDCHSEQSNEGDLRLHDQQSALRGGHTGKLLLISPAEKSELYQRLVSNDPSYRMPKKSDPLPTAEIAIIKAWLDQGAKWNDSLPSVSGGTPPIVDPSLPSQNKLGTVELLGQGLNDFLENPGRTRYRRLTNFPWLVAGWFVWLIFTILYKSRRLWRGRKRSDAGDAISEVEHRTQRPLLELLCDRLLLWRWLVLCLLAIVGTGAYLYQRGMIEELEVSLHNAKLSIRRQPALQITEDRKNLMLPVYPDHPPRLGGTYYRGNDERDPALFNGGVYLTATMELSLVDHEHQTLQWNARIEKEPWSISLVIHRAPRTTATLFSETVFQETHLRRFRETDLVSGNKEDESGRVGFTVLEPEQSWVARIPLEPSSNWKDGRNAGVIYVSYGSREMNGYQGRVHYGIRYDLRLKEGSLSPESVLWMGAIYDLGGRVLIPQNNEILLHNWFDYRPLPEIETDNPDDPELLGLPEHLGGRQ